MSYASAWILAAALTTVAIGLSSGEILDEFSISHEPEGFRQFFSRIEKQERRFYCPVAVAMEGFNGYVRPLDTLVRARDYRAIAR